ncbi:unnamed protein product [Mycena citricolor]|uniref:Uncharacterized protein n=1 Tax=Mycena citricolor TaxID=2018698 RepID=A0AAD2JUX4_9AGAR|nr:unnamed protein product [Mycena citricolor]
MSSASTSPSASWRQPVSASGAEAPPTMPLLHSKISFAVDASGSTAGRVMDMQKNFVLGMMEGYEYPNSVIMWGSSVEAPTAVSQVLWRERSWGTDPAVIFNTAATTSELKSCDMWYLLTDGEIGSPVPFAQKALAVGMANTPVVFVITNRDGSKPSSVNISVGISVFASAPDAAIVFKSCADGRIYVLAAKGAFGTLVDGFELDLENWESLPLFPTEEQFKAALKDVNIVGVQHRANGGAVDLGPTWLSKHQCLVDIDLLLTQMQPDSIPQDELIDLLQEDTFESLSLLCKTRGLLKPLRDWLLVRKESVTVIEMRDVGGAAQILQQIRDGAPSEGLREKLRAAHQTNLEDFRARHTSITPSPLVPLVNRCLAALTALEKAGYGADILDRRSNRAMRAALVDSSQVGQQLATLSLDESVEAYRSTCSICCSDDVIMSLALKSPSNPSDNTTDYALNFPLAAGAASHNQDVLSAQNVCFQCALAMFQMDPNRATMYNEAVAAVVPLTKFDGVNRQYISNCLASVLTGGLATGASGLAQVLMSILLTTMKTKEWAKESAGDEEIQTRRAGLLWMVDNLISNVSCRETFDETGPWVSFDKALRWTLLNFSEEGIYSWIVRYPIPGFLLLLDLLAKVGGVQIPQSLLVAKLVHEMVTVYMARIVRPTADKLAVQRQILKVVFSSFNAEGVPRHIDDSHAIIGPDAAFKTLDTWIGSPESSTLIEQIRAAGGDKYASALQYVAFKLFAEDSHQTPKGYLTRAAQADVHIQTAITKPEELTAAVVVPVFTAMWTGIAVDVDHASVTVETIAQFVSPYGPSTLKCGTGNCGVRFDGDGVHPDAVRKARAAHLSMAYGIAGVESRTGNGLPENTGRLQAPTTTHVTLHSSIYKSWKSLDRDARRLILEEVTSGHVDSNKTETASFIDKVMDHICLKSARGDIYDHRLRENVLWVLPSFFAALHKATVLMHLSDDAELELLDFSLAARIEWELEAEKL